MITEDTQSRHSRSHAPASFQRPHITWTLRNPGKNGFVNEGSCEVLPTQCQRYNDRRFYNQHFLTEAGKRLGQSAVTIQDDGCYQEPGVRFQWIGTRRRSNDFPVKVKPLS
ncbi:hypothetical protein SCLCIDRAFT_559991 [Scleroderma citrinum Foug A]|uniref:Uncharacterized protein n=1 Tax=Scleroderma citrinum Foug A TaxID=1036808 RepID=A0A0C3CV07_9AGAM|nr:hypothetical protein SCLCIDRAFT_559991 [Scleroderma citrinum Foug A]